MEPDATSRAVAPPPTEWRALSRLRERVESAAREIERLRTDNAALAARVAELQDGLGDDAPMLSLPDAGDPEALRARVQGFIDAIDEVLATTDPADPPSGNPAGSPAGIPTDEPDRDA